MLQGDPAKQTIQQEIDERTNQTSSNKLELLMIRLGDDPGHDRNELFGISEFKIREIISKPSMTCVAGSPPLLLSLVELRGQIKPNNNLPAVAGCTPITWLN